MRYMLLIARREFLENVRTKGFWIGILLFPAILLLFALVPRLIEQQATPTRFFVIVDPSAQFEPVIRARIARFHQKKILKALGSYATQHAKPENLDNASTPRSLDLESIPAPGQTPSADQILEEFAEDNSDTLDSWARAGGVQGLLSRLRPFIRDDAPPFQEPKESYRPVPLPDGLSPDADPQTLAAALRPYLRRDRRISVEGESTHLFAAVLVPKDVTNKILRPENLPRAQDYRPNGIQYWCANLADMALPDEIERAVNTEVRRREYAARGLDPAVVAGVERTRIPIEKLNPKKEAGKERVSMADYIRQWAPSGFVYLLWVAIFTVAQMLLNNTIEEKSNRIIEVLLSSVTPGELMMGKLLGIASVGLAMIGSWIAMLLGFLLLQTGPEAEFARQLLEVIRTSNLLPAFAVYFTLGYLMYAGLILSLGSVCNTLKEAQNYMGAIVLILMVPLLTMMFIPKDPNGALATTLSWVPIYTPFVMMNRATADPPTFELIGTMILLLASTALVLWLSGKIFRVGILRTGQPPKLFELLKWLREK